MFGRKKRREEFERLARRVDSLALAVCRATKHDWQPVAIGVVGATHYCPVCEAKMKRVGRKTS